jgi:hypothetical protein
MYEHFARVRLFVANGLNVTRGKNLFPKAAIENLIEAPVPPTNHSLR